MKNVEETKHYNTVKRRRIPSGSKKRTITMYTTPPMDLIELHMFEEFAFNRLKLYNIMQDAFSGIDVCECSEADYKLKQTCVLNALEDYSLSKYSKILQAMPTVSDEDYDIFEEDYNAHYILKLAHCKGYYLANYFLEREIEIFYFKLSYLSISEVIQLMHDYCIEYKIVTPDEKALLKEKLISCAQDDELNDIEMGCYYKVPFIFSLPLMKNFKVFLGDGMAYVLEKDLRLVVLSYYYHQLATTLEGLVNPADHFKDDKVRLFLKLLTNYQINKLKKYEPPKSETHLSLSKLDKVATKYFPPCMKVVHDTLRANHHLRHQGRLQYMFFLKGAGMTYDELMKLWYEEFTKIMSEDEFNREYVYSIHHAYGHVGKMVSHGAYDCEKLQMMIPENNLDICGCPFKLWERTELETHLKNLNLDQSTINTMLYMHEGKDYRHVCSSYLDNVSLSETSPSNLESVIHPNQYFDECVSKCTELF